MGFGSSPIQARTVVRQDVAPSNTDVLWLDTNTSPPTLKQYDSGGSSWVGVAPEYVTAQDTQPSNPVQGDLWVDTDATPQRVNQWTGTQWTGLTNFGEFDTHRSNPNPHSNSAAADDLTAHETDTTNPHSVDHGQLSGIGASDHHSRPTSTQTSGSSYAFMPNGNNVVSPNSIGGDTNTIRMPTNPGNDGAGVVTSRIRLVQVENGSEPDEYVQFDEVRVVDDSLSQYDGVSGPDVTTVWTGTSPQLGPNDDFWEVEIDLGQMMRVTKAEVDWSSAGQDYSRPDFTVEPAFYDRTSHSHSI